MNPKNDNPFSGINIIEDLKKYAELTFEKYHLSFVEKTSLLIGKIVLIGAIGIFIVILLLLFLLMIHNILESFIGINWLVSLIEIAVVGAMTLTLWLNRDRLIVRPVANMMVKIIYSRNDVEKDQEEDNNE